MIVRDPSEKVTLTQAGGIQDWQFCSHLVLKEALKNKLKENKALRIMSAAFVECENPTWKVIERKKEVLGKMSSH